VALAWSGFVVAGAADDNSSNTGMADPTALINAYDRFVGGDESATVVALSLSNLRGIASEAVNAGGRVTVDLTTGTVDSFVQLLPGEGTFDLWLIDDLLSVALQQLRGARSALANPVTLPPSFRN
jgi:hypothetical protein